ncbi:GntR family transcriptional regulator [Cellulomonas sp. DKR-3]|uniref:GntR family transcriptional regulator n=1 Tax=Cellulomonas fulva TaxID=2835530 RepID=A0ABS5TV56_9CELL|nr:GntR family transcriptional regulator [Cellulomonas fulva]MBT0992994.1 GntR family transcriptional regulator [Cellulomonas fulva]
MPIPTDPSPLAAPSRDAAYAVLERALVTGALAPGSRLSDDELVRLTGTSRAPLREALNALAAVGLVDVAPRRSTHVTPLDGRASREALEIDGAVLTQALTELAGRGDHAARERLAAARDAVLPDADAYRAAVAEHRMRGLLRTILDGAGNLEYARVSAAVAPVVDRYAALHAGDLPDEHHARMRAAVDSALAGDPPAARESWRALVDALVADAAMTGRRDEPPAPAPPATLRERAAAAIEQAIHDGTLLPGETLRESELMTWLGISRTPVREALTALDRAGLVVQSHHRSARVAEPDERDVRDLMRALGVLRALAVRLAMQRDPDALARALAATLPAWDDVHDPASFARAAGSSFDAITDAGGSTRLRTLTSTLAARGRWSVAPSAYGTLAADGTRLRELHALVVAGRSDDAQAAVWTMCTGEEPAGVSAGAP